MFGLLLGAWHGASWNFVLWGLYFGVILIIEKLFLLKVLDKLPKIVGHIYTLFLVLISWVIFAFEDLGQIGTYLSTMFGLNGANLANAEAIYYLKNYIIIIIIGIIGSIPLKNIIKKWAKNNENKTNENKTQNVVNMKKRDIVISVCASFCFIAVLLLSTASLVNNSFNPFLYFRF